MANFPTWTPVVAAALIDKSGQILLQQRAADKHHGGLWEFPGGKVEPGEDPRAALVRELAEELAIGLDPEAFEPAGFADEQAQEWIVLFLYTSRFLAASPNPQEGQNWGWFTPDAAENLALAPMDRQLLMQLIR